MQLVKRFMLLLLGLAKSLLFVVKHLVTARKAQVIFYYPRHFNRTARGTNPFFDRLIDACREAGLSVLTLEGGQSRKEHRRNREALPIDILLGVMYVVERVFLRHRFKRLEDRDQHLGCMEAGRIINVLTFGKFRAPVYITISNAMVAFFKGMNPTAAIVDVQHGIIHPTHPGYFEPDKNMRPSLMASNLSFFVMGEGFRQCFMQTAGNRAMLSGRVHVIGDVMKSDQTKSSEPRQGRAILFSLQFTCELKGTQPESMRRRIYNLAEECRPLAERLGVVLRFKLRPNDPPPNELAGIERQFPFVEFSAGSMAQACEGVFYHVTFYSTVAFDVARWGIPTYFLTTSDIPHGTMFHNEYDYPVQRGNFSEVMTEALTDARRYDEIKAQVILWRGRFYAPFDGDRVVALVRDYIEKGI